METQFDRLIERRGTDCLKYDFAEKRENLPMYCPFGWRIWTFRHPPWC
jgi:hypothetical protein